MLANIIKFTTIALTFLGAIACPIRHPAQLDTDPAPDEIIIPGVDGTCGSTAASLKKYLIDAGYSVDAASGILGNLMQESGISITSIEDSSVRPLTTDFVAYDFENDKKTFRGGFGIAQWDYKTRVKALQTYANNYANGVVVSEKAQFGYLVQELNKSLSPSVLNSKSLEEVTWIIVRSFENPFSVRCTESNPCTSYSFTCDDGDHCRYTGQTNSRGKKQIAYWNDVNTHNAKTSYDELVNNKSKYLAAWRTWNKRTEYAQNAKNIDINKCTGTSSQDDDSPSDPQVPTSDPDPDNPTVTTTGAIGARSSNSFYRQDQYKNVIWRKDGSTIFDSGCSLIAVANSMKVLGVNGSDPNSLASYTKMVILGEAQTGWGSTGKSIDMLLNKYNISKKTLWSNYSTPTATKIQAIRNALASGKAIIAGGDRKNITPGMTTCPDASSGVCVFSYNGHFVAIVGITADDKLVIANPARGNGRGNVFNADNVLKYSNKAISVEKK